MGILMSRRGRGRENGMQQCRIKREVKETRNTVRDGNTTNQTDENSGWLHMHSTYSNDAEQLSDGPVPLSSISGTGDVDDIDIEEDISIVHETDTQVDTLFYIICLRGIDLKPYIFIRTYSWIYWRTKEIDIGDIFLPI
ncbi:uncharacterized protein [Miscanthus floridulus]|uniref:uncharacterized protein isoform X2 n=1 Tax=Miscanthus floridulus TaxID=154761 RepID=UPI00345A7E55